MQIFKNGGSIIMQTKIPFKEAIRKLSDLLFEDKDPTLITIKISSNNENTINKIISDFTYNLKKKQIDAKINRTNDNEIYNIFIEFKVWPDINLLQYNTDKFIVQVIEALYDYDDVMFDIYTTN